MDRFVDLDAVGVLEDSDKSSSIRFGWDYLRHYEMLLAEYRDLPINLLEIGVSRGGSLRTWAWYFPNAHITGIDINPDCARHAAPRISVEIGSQTDTAFLDRVCDNAPPTIIFDDGSHNYEHMILTFEHLLPRLLPGGLYVIEDIAFHFGPTAKPRGGKPNVPEYFLDLARCCLANKKLEPSWGTPPHIADQVDRVAFIGQAVAMHKHDPHRDVARGLATAEEYAARQPHAPGRAANLAEWILLHDGPAERAEQLIHQAMQAEPGNPKLKLMQADALLRQGKATQAEAILSRFSGKRPENPRLLVYLATLLARTGNIAPANSIRDVALAAKGMRLAKHKLQTLLGAP